MLTAPLFGVGHYSWTTCLVRLLCLKLVFEASIVLPNPRIFSVERLLFFAGKEVTAPIALG